MIVDLRIFFLQFIKAVKGQYLFVDKKNWSFVRLTPVSIASRLADFDDFMSS